MSAFASPNHPPSPLANRRLCRALERSARLGHEQDQLEALRAMAADGLGVTGLTAYEESQASASPLEMVIAGRRLRAARVSRRAILALREAVSSIAAVPLTAVGRYGPYWVLTFRVAKPLAGSAGRTEPLVVLADRLTLLPDWAGPGGRTLLPWGPVLQGV